MLPKQQQIRKNSFLLHRRIKTSNDLINTDNININLKNKQTPNQTSLISCNTPINYNIKNNLFMKNSIKKSHPYNPYVQNFLSFNNHSKQRQKQEYLNEIFQKAKKSYYQYINFQQVIQYLEQYLTYKQNDNQALYLCGISYLNLDNPFQAINKLQNITFNYPNKPNSLLLLSIAYCKLQYFQKSLQIINQCINKYPKFQSAYSYRGKLYLKFYSYQKALKDFQYSLKLNPYSFINMVALGDCYYRQLIYEEAIRWYEKALEYLYEEEKQMGNKWNQKLGNNESYQKIENNPMKNTMLRINLLNVDQKQRINQDKIQEQLQNNSKSLHLNSLNPLNNNSKILSLKNNLKNISDILLKQSICLYELQKYQQVIKNLQKLTKLSSNFYKNSQNLPCQYYFYNGMSFLKLNKKQQSILNLQYCIKLQTNKLLIIKSFKVLIEIYLNDYQFYQALNLIKLINLNQNKRDGQNEDQGEKIKPIKVQNSVKDETTNRNNNLEIFYNEIKYWKYLIQGCMLIIKAYYKQGLQKLNQIYQMLKNINQNNNNNNIANDQSLNKQPIQLQPKSKKKNLFSDSNPNTNPLNNKKQSSPTHSNQKIYKRKSFSLKHVKKFSIYDDINSNYKIKSTLKTIRQKDKIITPKMSNDLRINMKLKKIFSSSQNQKGSFNGSGHTRSKSKVKFFAKKDNNNQIIQNFTFQQSLFVMPIILKFRAYAEFFSNNYLKALQIYDQHEAYMKNMFGKQLNNQILYNKLMSQALLLNQSELHQQSLNKFNHAIQEYRLFYDVLPVQPFIYKTALLLRLFMLTFHGNHVSDENELTNTSKFDKNQHSNKKKEKKHKSKIKGYDYLEQILDINRQNKKLLSNHHLTHYYLGIMYYLCEKYTQAQQQLEKALKIVQECTWRILYVKGVIEIFLQNYYDAIKQFTAGMIFQNNPFLYLGRSVAFLLEGTKRRKKQLTQNLNNSSIIAKHSIDFKNIIKNNKNKKAGQKTNKINKQISSSQKQVTSEIFIENSFQDLQKFIECQSDQQRISLWVTKILFYNQAYEQAIKALEKIDNKSEELNEIQTWLKIYQGDFQQCGQFGYLIIDAFQGNLLTEKQQKNLFFKQKQDILMILQNQKISVNYSKWLIILHLLKRQNYPLLIKYIQKSLFQTQNIEQLIQLRFNLSLIYLINGDRVKANNLLETIRKNITEQIQNLNNNNDSLSQNNQKLLKKINKLINLQIDQDQCINDLTAQLGQSQNHKLSEYLPYKAVVFKNQKIKKFFVKFSIPFPKFPKPNLILQLQQQFLLKQLQLSQIQKKIQAPWIKKNKTKIQFTQAIIQAETDFLKQTKQMEKQNKQIHQEFQS